MICFEDKAPVCKSLMIYVGCSHAATHIPSLAPVFRKIFTESIGIESTKSLLRLIASKLVFPDSRSTILVCFLVYFFRILERRSGSLKFSSNLLTSWILGLSLDLLLSPTLPDPWSPYLTPGNFINCHQCRIGKCNSGGRLTICRIGNYFTFWKNLLFSIFPSKNNCFKIKEKVPSCT